MLKIYNKDNSLIVEGLDNGLYPDNGQNSYPLNSLIIVTDDSDIVTFRSAATNDVLFSGVIENITINGEAVTKDNIIAKFDAVSNVEAGGGSGGGMTDEEREELKNLRSDVENALGDISALEIDKQDKLKSGENIKTVNGESLLGEGNIEIQGESSSSPYYNYEKFFETDKVYNDGYWFFPYRRTITKNNNLTSIFGGNSYNYNSKSGYVKFVPEKINESDWGKIFQIDQYGNNVKISEDGQYIISERVYNYSTTSSYAKPELFYINPETFERGEIIKPKNSEEGFRIKVGSVIGASAGLLDFYNKADDLTTQYDMWNINSYNAFGEMLNNNFKTFALFNDMQNLFNSLNQQMQRYAEIPRLEYQMNDMKRIDISNDNYKSAPIIADCQIYNMESWWNIRGSYFIDLGQIEFVNESEGIYKRVEGETLCSIPLNTDNIFPEVSQDNGYETKNATYINIMGHGFFIKLYRSWETEDTIKMYIIPQELILGESGGLTPEQEEKLNSLSPLPAGNYLAKFEQNGGQIDFTQRGFDGLSEQTKSISFNTINGQSLLGQSDIKIDVPTPQTGYQGTDKNYIYAQYVYDSIVSKNVYGIPNQFDTETYGGQMALTGKRWGDNSNTGKWLVLFKNASALNPGPMSVADKVKLDSLSNEWTGTQSEYDELGTYDDNTTYYVVEE